MRRALRTAALAGLAAAVALVIAMGRPYPRARLSPDEDAPLVVTDRDGRVLRQVASASGRREAWVALDAIPSAAVMALLASEDARFFAHGAIDARALGRAAWLDARAGRAAYGGSTITMQLARLLRPELAHRSPLAKLRQIIDAVRLERALDKRAILEQYLNRAYYGNGAVGIEAAARTYFGKPAHALGVGEATLLAVLPRAPTRYDPLRRLDEALRRRAHVLDLLERAALLSPEERRRAEAEPLRPALHAAPFLAPHFVELALAQLPAEVRARGGVVRTTLDLALQGHLEHRLREHVAALADRRLTQAGALLLDTRSGEIRALVGSVDFDGAEGQVDITTLRRHPGSALKPFVYAAAIEAGASPAAIAADAGDVPSSYLVAHDRSLDRGPLRYREALAGSYNLAAVHVLEEVGIERVIGRLRAAGLGPLDEDPARYGLRLALGAASVRLVDLAAAYGFLVRGGRVVPARAVLEVAHAHDVWRPPAPVERRVFSARASWLTMDILADPEPRHLRFGEELPFDLPFPVAAKTGTSRGFADTVAVGVTREWTVAAWGGNFDGKPSHGLLAMDGAAPLVRAGLLLVSDGAAPLVRAGLLLVSDGRALTLPPRPPGIVEREVCALSGLTPGASCPRRKLERFDAAVPAPRRCEWHREDGVRLPAIYARWAARTHASRRLGREAPTSLDAR